MKRVSIILCTYNGADYLEEQIDSLLAQSHPFHELIVQDDCSTDDTVRIIRQYQSRNPQRHIRLFINATQNGYNRNFLTACQRAEGEYIACCDQDDIWRKDKLEIMVKEIGECAMAFHNSMLMDNNHHELGLLHVHPLPSRIHPLAAVLYPRAYGHQIMFHRILLPRLKCFIEQGISYDYLIYAVAGSLTPVCYVAAPLVSWRRHRQATTYRSDNRSSGRWSGYLQALLSLGDKGNRERTRRFFQQLSQIEYHDDCAAYAVRHMSQGGWHHILQVCWLSLRHAHDTVFADKGTLRLLRAFFLPLFFIRDHGRYIVQL